MYMYIYLSVHVVLTIASQDGQGCGNRVRHLIVGYQGDDSTPETIKQTDTVIRELFVSVNFP